jgi:pimeloyl-ACP methyl ester carboxylesterase
MTSAPTAEQRSRSGTFANGMEYLTWGSGPKTLLYIQGGPGSVVPRGMQLRMSHRLLDPYAKAGYAIWVITRRRHMPAGHTIAGMADDYAQVISQEFGGRVDLVVGESYGGLIAQYLAAFHPGSFGHMAMVVTGAEVNDWGKDVDSRYGAALARGDAPGAGTVMAEYLLPAKSMRWVRRLIGPLFGRLMFAGLDCPPGDILVEAQAEEAFDSRAVLPRIQAPVLLICGDRDRFFPRDVVKETAKLIPGCTLIWHKGGHMRAGTSRRVADDVLAFAHHS